MTTRAQLAEAITSWTSRPDLSAQMDTIILLAEQEIAAAVRVQDQITRVDHTLNSGRVALPSDFAALISLTLQGNQRALMQVTPQVLRASCEASTSGTPTLFAIEGDHLLIAPAASALDPVTADLAYYQRPTALVNADDTNWLLANHYAIYLWAGIKEAAAFVGDDELEARALARFENAVERLHASEVAKQQGGAPIESYVDWGP